ncbi:hypothetical protein BRYFOR_07295 [Marvinbryantia formatexigens DSM 14469]|uniref:Uncharacterized protein n=1 Tax=Marvinbryantia formatexigens DSM 14469 TaxID=478749 RepID=C6LF93_9FIRM|nr:hypothetical protein BRYFOR_07295 [Marvinbryantia formatexigens DSM 14469]
MLNTVVSLQSLCNEKEIVANHLQRFPAMQQGSQAALVIC